MTTLELVVVGVELFSTIALVVSVAFAWRRIVAMQHGHRGQRLLALVQYLQDPEIRACKDHVLHKLEAKPLADWTEQDHEKASGFCGAYGTAGMLERLGYVRIDDLDSYTGSVVRGVEICGDFIRERQQLIPGHWRDLLCLSTKLQIRLLGAE